MRLDKLLVERGLVATRSRAEDLIRRGQVLVDGRLPGKPGEKVLAEASLQLLEDAGYVSRGALKLRAALAAFAFSPEGRVALDAGSSTGGFTQVLLEEGASRVYAVDVGEGQLHPLLARDPRVTSLERTDVRSLTHERITGPITAITVDVSFISLTKALPALLALAAEGCWLVALIKPQFEVGRDFIGKGGIVVSDAAKADAPRPAEAMLTKAGWSVRGVIPSPIAGRDGNDEFLLGALRGVDPAGT